MYRKRIIRKGQHHGINLLNSEFGSWEGLCNGEYINKNKDQTEKTIIQKDACTPMFTAALFTIARSRKQPKCPSTDEWIKKMWYIYTMEYYSAIKRNKIGSFVEMWMDLETVI